MMNENIWNDDFDIFMSKFDGIQRFPLFFDICKILLDLDGNVNIILRIYEFE